MCAGLSLQNTGYLPLRGVFLVGVKNVSASSVFVFNYDSDASGGMDQDYNYFVRVKSNNDRE